VFVDETELLHKLAHEWQEQVRPHVRVNACILAARLTHEVLDYFNIPHDLQPVRCTITNDIMWDCMVNAESPRFDFPPEAWSLGVGKGLGDGDGWSGHIVVITNNNYIDLSAEQFDRPRRDILSGGPLILPQQGFSYVDKPAVKMWHHPLPKGHLIWAPEHNPSYKQAIDWRSNYKLVAGPIIRSIKQSDTR
jgi:hypothetical protein